jgi:hypothetical protein
MAGPDTYFERQRAQSHEAVEQALNSLAESKAEEIAIWMRERRAHRWCRNGSRFRNGEMCSWTVPEIVPASSQNPPARANSSQVARLRK